MSRRTISFAPGEFYHIYNRGTEKRNVFLNKRDYERFTALLYLANDTTPIDIPFSTLTKEKLFSLSRLEPLVEIGAYVLMPNHFHLLLREKKEGGISKFMQKLLTAYTMYFNRRVERNGSLFQGKFKATHADNDAYLKYLISYIHLNPVKLIEPAWKETGIADRKKAQKYLEKYTYSSYDDFLQKDRPEKSVVAVGALPEYFETVNDFKSCVKEWLNYNVQSPRGKASGI